MARKHVLTSLVLVAAAALATPAWANCPPPTAPVTTPVLAHPFEAQESADGCALFVSLVNSNTGSVGYYTWDGKKVTAAQSIPVPGRLGMLILTHDGKLAIVATRDGVAFLDTALVAAGDKGAVLGTINGLQGSVGLAVTPDDATLFVSNENNGTVTVIDLAKARANGFAADSVLGTVVVNALPVGLAVSSDGRLLYSTSQTVPSGPTPCAVENDSGDTQTEGVLTVIDVAKARTDAAGAVLGSVSANCSPVRVALSPSGDRAYVTARGGNQVVVFDTAKILSDPANAQIASVPDGLAPVGIALTADGAIGVVANSNRFDKNPNAVDSLTVFDTAHLAKDIDVVTRSIPAGAFPRELTITPDNVVLVSNFKSKTLQLVPLTK
jgi:DNA-binding beta-propeller fold protein YncE